MTQSAPSLATEAAKHGNYPRKFNKREQQVAASTKTYVDATVAAAVDDTAYNATSWNSVTTIAPSKNAVRDKIEAMVSDTAYNESTWNGVDTVAPSKNAVRDKIEALDTAKQNSITMGQDTTGTAGTAGEIAIASMTATGKVIVTIAEDPGSNLALSHVIADTGKITVYTRNTNTDAAAALSGKKVNYLVISLS